MITVWYSFFADNIPRHDSASLLTVAFHELHLFIKIFHILQFALFTLCSMLFDIWYSFASLSLSHTGNGVIPTILFGRFWFDFSVRLVTSIIDSSWEVCCLYYLPTKSLVNNPDKYMPNWNSAEEINQEVHMKNLKWLVLIVYLIGSGIT